MEIPATRPGKFPTPTVAWERPDDPAQPLVILLHGRGSRESEIIGLAGHLPDGASYAALRAPIQEGPGFAWFANRGIGRPLPDSLAMTLAWFKDWLEEAAPAGRPVLLVGFSGGAAFAGGLILDQPERFKGAAILYGTLPFDAGVPTGPGRLQDVPMFVAQGESDTVIPAELMDATWKYLAAGSGARTTGIRTAGGHRLDAPGAAALAGWLEEQLPGADT